MKITPKMQVEVFHLLFLRQFSSQTAENIYAIKGDCNLRFFFGSVRYSEDLDIDVTIIQKHTLANKVNKILQSPAFLKLLQEYAIHRITFAALKQTQTTQRWKIQLHGDFALPLNTKIEFSRRVEKYSGELGNVTMAICQRYHLAPMRLPHYGIQDAISQKISALAHRSQTQARDIFDLYHLLHIASPKKLSIAKNTKDAALLALQSIRFSDYQSQVMNFLESDKQKLFDHQDYWQEMITQVKNYLENVT